MNVAVKACVIGWPVAHSRSPLIHRYWLAHYRIDGSYEAVPVEPAALGTFVEALRRGAYAGCNVTVPHKEAVLAHVDSVDAVASRLGAANTLVCEDGRVAATNTDGYGFMAHLRSSAPDLELAGATVTVLGAGGAARAIAGALVDEGAGMIRLVNRTRARAERLKRDLDGPLEVWDWDARVEALAACALLVNATSLGMAGAPALELDLAALPREAVVADIVYAPLETDLLKRARARGHRAVDGLGMLLHQAVPGFEAWFGVRPEVTPALREHVLAAITERT